MAFVDLPCRWVEDLDGSGAFLSANTALVAVDADHAVLSWDGSLPDDNLFARPMPDGTPPFGVAVLPEGATPTEVRYVAVGYRTYSGGDGNHPASNVAADPHASSVTYPTLQVRFNGDGTTFAGWRLEPFPVGDYTGVETFSAALPTSLWRFFIDGYGTSPGPSYTGIQPELFCGPRDYDMTPLGISGGEVFVQYLAVRVWYDEGDTEPPILRVLPRTDGRAGGARRVWPPNKVVQDGRWLPFGGGYR